MKRINKIKKELYKKYGIDWQQSEKIKITKIDGKDLKTIKSIAKLLDLKKENLNLIFFYWTKEHGYYDYDYFKGIELSKEDISKFSLIDNMFNLSSFYSKKDVNAALKEEEKELYIIEVMPDAVTGEKKDFHLDNKLFYNDDLNFRVKIKNDAYISSVNLQRIQDVYVNGKKYLLEISYLHGRIGSLKKYTLADFIDKSGYSLINHRNKLNSRLQAKKNAHLVDAIKSRKFLKENDKLFYAILKIKDTIADDLRLARNSHRLYKKADFLYDLSYLMKDFERHESKIEKADDEHVSSYDKYTTIEQVEENIENLTEKIKNFKEKYLRGE